jgi:hypothetical protein
MLVITLGAKVVVVLHDGGWRLAVHSDFGAGGAGRGGCAHGRDVQANADAERPRAVPKVKGRGSRDEGQSSRVGTAEGKRVPTRSGCGEGPEVFRLTRVEASTPEGIKGQRSRHSHYGPGTDKAGGYHTQTQHKGKVESGR